MAGLIEEIQALSLDGTVKIADLLRRVKLAAVKLNLQDAIEWVDLELKGYADDAETPPYRQTVGQLRAHSPYHGVLPVPKTADWVTELCARPVRDSIARVETLAGEGKHEIIANVSGLIASGMNSLHNTPGTEYYIHTPQNLFVDILEQVRNLILDWAIELEKAGILGEGISFTVEEKQKAEQASHQITINYGHIHNGDLSGNQNKTVIDSTDNSVNTINTENVFDQLIQAIDSSIGNQRDREELLGLAEAMKASQGTEEYQPLFQKWVGYLADYATILGPFVPALGQFI